MVVERINRREREKEEARLQKERKESEVRERRRVTEKQLEIERRQKDEESIRFRREYIRRILQEGGIVSALSDIERDRLEGTTKKHNLIVDSEKGEVTLIWGSKYNIKEGKIYWEKPFLGGESRLDYSLIKVKVHPNENPDRRGIIVEDSSGEPRFLSDSQMRNRELVLDRLAEAYLKPKRVNLYESNLSPKYQPP